MGGLRFNPAGFFSEAGRFNHFDGLNPFGPCATSDPAADPALAGLAGGGGAGAVIAPAGTKRVGFGGSGLLEDDGDVEARFRDLSPDVAIQLRVVQALVASASPVGQAIKSKNYMIDARTYIDKFLKAENAIDLMQVMDSLQPEGLFYLGKGEGTPGNVPSDPSTFNTFPSYAIHGHAPIAGVEYNKLAMSYRIIQALLNRDFTFLKTSFVAPIQKDEDLERFRAGFIKMLGPDSEGQLEFNPEKLRAFLAHMASHDLGKVAAFKLAFETASSDVLLVNHDNVLAEALAMGFHCLTPTYREKLTQEGRDLFMAAVKAAAQMNFPQIPQGEAAPSMLASMMGMSGEEVEFFMYHLMFDTYGAKGFQNPTQPWLPAFFHPLLEKAIPHLKAATSGDEGFDPIAAFSNIIKQGIGSMANHLDLKTSEGLALARLMGHFPSRMGAATAEEIKLLEAKKQAAREAGAHDDAVKAIKLTDEEVAGVRLTKTEKLEAFLTAWDRLNDAQRRNLINAYGANGIDKGSHGLTMQYAPQLIENAFYYYTDVDHLPAAEALAKALDACLPFIARVGEKIGDLLADRPETIPAFMVNFQKAADVVKKPATGGVPTFSPDILKISDILITGGVDGVNVAIKPAVGPVLVTGDALDGLVEKIAAKIQSLDPAQGKFKFLLDLDGTVIGSGPDDQISDEVLEALTKLSAHPNVEIHIITHTGKSATINKLLAIPGINIIGDAGGYKLATDGSVAEWYVDDKYVQAVNQYWSVFAGIVKYHLDQIPEPIREKVTHQIKKLSQDVVYDKKDSELVARMDTVLQAIAADIEKYISDKGLSDLFKSYIRQNSDGGAELYWDLKVNTPVSKDMPVARIVNPGDYVLLADDDSKYGIAMHMAAYGIVGREHAYTVFVEGNSRGPSKDPKTLSRLTHAVADVRELDFLLVQVANSLPE